MTTVVGKKTVPVDEPSRVKKLRLELVNEIPRFPNTREALQEMEQKHLSSVLVDYINWRSRYVGIRPRQVEIEAVAKADPRWSAMSVAIEAFLEKVRRGDDLTPHLSLAPHTRGYALTVRGRGATNDDRWSDKDPLLIRMGYHHFHLGMAVEAAGHVARTNNLIFAEVGREIFKVIAIFNHDVFDRGSTERRRLEALHDMIIFRGIPPGAGVLKGPVVSSGHAMHTINYAQWCTRLIEHVDPQLDDRAYIETLYAQGKIDLPPDLKLEWHFIHLDLVVYDRAATTAFCFGQGWN